MVCPSFVFCAVSSLSILLGCWRFMLIWCTRSLCWAQLWLVDMRFKIVKVNTYQRHTHLNCRISRIFLLCNVCKLLCVKARSAFLARGYKDVMHFEKVLFQFGSLAERLLTYVARVPQWNNVFVELALNSPVLAIVAPYLTFNLVRTITIYWKNVKSMWNTKNAEANSNIELGFTPKD